MGDGAVQACRKSPGKVIIFWGRSFSSLPQPRAAHQLYRFRQAACSDPQLACSQPWNMAHEDGHPAGHTIPRPHLSATYGSFLIVSSLRIYCLKGETGDKAIINLCLCCSHSSGPVSYCLFCLDLVSCNIVLNSHQKFSTNCFQKFLKAPCLMLWPIFFIATKKLKLILAENTLQFFYF